MACGWLYRGGRVMLKALFGGTFGYIQAALIGVAAIALMAVWRDYQGAKKDVTRLTGEVTDLQGTIKSKDTVIASMGRTAGRRSTQDNQSKDLGNEILKAPDGKDCARSEPIRTALDGLRLDARKKAPDTTDKVVSVLAGAYPTDTE